MAKNQYIAIAIASIIVLVMYFGLDTIPPKAKALEKSRSENFESTSLSNLVKDATPLLSKEKQNLISAINLDLDNVGSDTLKKIEILKSLSGVWYENGFASIAGVYAEEIANSLKTEDAWSLTGTTFALCVKNSTDDKIKQFCSKRAIRAFEKAVSIAPDNIDHRINLAICYVDNPMQDNPMQGILMLRELNEKHPKNVSVLNQLATLALSTNQIDRAIQRLEESYAIDSNNNKTICLLAAAYKAKGDSKNASEFELKCVN